MIPVTCACGKRLKARDEHAGRRVKCPACSEPLSIPNPENDADEDDFSDPWDAEPMSGPAPLAQTSTRAGSRTQKSAKGAGKPRSKSQSKFKLTWRRMLAVPVMLLGAAILVVGVIMLANGKPFRIRGFIFPLVMISIGWAWLRDQTV